MSNHIKDALEHARMFIENGVELGYIRLPDKDTPDPVHETLPKIKAALSQLTASPDREKVAAQPTEAQVSSACLSYRHDYGLLPPDHRTRVRFEALEWLRAWQKEGFGSDRDEIIERCAAVVDQCNREGPYQAIGAATKIRALKTDPTIAPDEAAIRADEREKCARLFHQAKDIWTGEAAAAAIRGGRS